MLDCEVLALSGLVSFAIFLNFTNKTFSDITDVIGMVACILIESISWIDKILAIMNAMKATHYYNKASQVLGPLYIK